MSNDARTVIAVDGPSASGKGTLCRKLAEYYDLALLDTGLLYRASAKQCHDAGVDLDDEEAVAAHVAHAARIDTDAAGLREERIAAMASRIATYPALRRVLFAYQREFALNPPSGVGAVLDGRDIGTRIFPETPFKFYLVASATARAERRFKEMRAYGLAPSFERILAEVEARDELDASRQAAPLRAADDAVVIDSTALEATEVFALVQQHLQRQHFCAPRR